MYYGAQYYPEHWPEDRWPIDAEMMRRAGLNGVRMGEFAWSALEPKEDHYDFGWLDRAVGLLAEHGVKTIMCTSSRTPPPWVFREYPEMLTQTPHGICATPGERYTMGHAHPEFIALAQRHDRAVIEHYADNDNVIAWHIDNEIGARNDCYCPRCRSAFHEYLRAKYGTVDALNDTWGRHFWSFTIHEFEDVPIPDGKMANPQLALEYRRFLSQLNVDFTRWRYELMKELSPDKWVTTNFQSHRAGHTDYFQMGDYVDVFGANVYPPRSPEFILDFYRGARGTFLSLEQFTRLAPNDIGDGWMRLWAWQSIAHGACGVNFFRWRQCRWGQEQHRDGMLSHSGAENRRYREMVRMGEEMAKLNDLLDTTTAPAKAAIVMSYESRWALDAGVQDKRLCVLSETERFHTGLMKRNVTTDAMDPREDLSKYSLVIAPRLFVVDDEIDANLRSYVENGGVLCLTAVSGIVNEFNVSFKEARPGPLRELAGVISQDFLPLEKPVALSDDAGVFGDGLAEGTLVCDELELESATALATFDSGWRKGMPAITINSFGQGKVVTIAAAFEGDTLDAFLQWLCDEAGVESIIDTPDDVSAYERRGDDVRLLFLANRNEDEARTIDVGAGWVDALTDEPCSQASIEPVDVRILRKDLG